MKNLILQISKKLILPLLVAVLLFDVQVDAGVDNSCAVNIPVEIKNQGSNVPSGINSTLEIKPGKTDNPMPSSNEIIVVDNGKSEFGPISYNTPGVYKYSISQKVEDNNNLAVGVLYVITDAPDIDMNSYLTIEEFEKRISDPMPSANRPENPKEGQCYFDTTLKQPIWFDGENWVDAMGNKIV